MAADGRADHNGGMRATTAARVLHAIVAVAIVASIAIQIVLLLTGGADANSGESGDSVDVGVRLVRLFLFFTIDSNIIVLITSIVLIVDPARRGFWWEALRLNALVAITVTGVVYAVLLAPHIHIGGWALVSMIGLHVVSPIGFVGAWLLLGPRRRFGWLTVPAAFVLPVIWIAVTFVRGAIVDWYPYPFLDVTSIGLGSALRNAALILAAAGALAVLYRVIDARVPSLASSSRGNEPLRATSPR